MSWLADRPLPHAAVASLRGRPGPRLYGRICPWTNSSPHQTPQGSALPSAIARQLRRTGHLMQRRLASSTPSGVTANQRSGSSVWHGKPGHQGETESASGNGGAAVCPAPTVLTPPPSLVLRHADGGRGRRTEAHPQARGSRPGAFESPAPRLRVLVRGHAGRVRHGARAPGRCGGRGGSWRFPRVVDRTPSACGVVSWVRSTEAAGFRCLLALPRSRPPRREGPKQRLVAHEESVGPRWTSSQVSGPARRL